MKKKIKKVWREYSDEIVLVGMVLVGYFAVYLTGYKEGQKALEHKLVKEAIALKIEK